MLINRSLDLLDTAQSSWNSQPKYGLEAGENFGGVKASWVLEPAFYEDCRILFIVGYRTGCLSFGQEQWHLRAAAPASSLSQSALVLKVV